MNRRTITRPWLLVAVVGVLVLTLVWIGLGMVMFLLGPPGYEFRTVGLYEAPRSGYSIEISALGFVRAGHDLSDSSSAVAHIRPLDGRKGRLIDLTFEGLERTRFAIGGSEQGEIRRTFRSGPRALADLLARAGYEEISGDEVEETHAVINGALSGPKGTTLRGQSKVLKVVRVDFSRL